MKRGQIAHVDHDPTNNDLSNLVWLCLEHHDQYDSRSSQSKNLTTSELLQYRDLLYSYRTKTLRATEDKGLSTTIETSNCAAVEWKGLLGRWNGADSLSLEALIQRTGKSSGVVLVINRDWDVASYSNVEIDEGERHRAPDLSSPGIIARVEDNQSAVFRMQLCKAPSGTYLDVKSTTHDQTTKKHHQTSRSIFCKYGIHETDSIAVWSLGSEFPPGSTFTLRQ